MVSAGTRGFAMLNRKLRLALVAVAALVATLSGAIEEPQTTFAYAGTVVDPQGRPMSGVEVTASWHDEAKTHYGYIAIVQTDADGRFSIKRSYPAKQAAAISADKTYLEFN